MSFELHPGAEKDLENASDYYRNKAGRIVADRFLEEFYRAASHLSVETAF